MNRNRILAASFAATFLTLVACASPAGMNVGTPDPVTNGAPAAVNGTPSKSDFQVTLKIKTKQCTSGYGCVLTYTPRLSWVGSGPKPGDGTSYDITFQVTGGDGGPATDTITTDGSNYNKAIIDSMATVKSSTTKLVATVVQVENNNA